MHAPSLPNYKEITETLVAISSNLDAAQVHGLFCGYICTNSAKNWEKNIFGKKIPKKYRGVFQQLYAISARQLDEFSFEFTLLLPDENEGIHLRTEALGLWCQGFLTSLEQSHIALQNRSASEMTDTLNDFIEIAQVSFDEITADDEAETAYWELVEYVRLGTLLIFAELQKPDTLEQNQRLHS